MVLLMYVHQANNNKKQTKWLAGTKCPHPTIDCVQQININCDEIILEHGCPATFSARIQPLPDPAGSEDDLYQNNSQIAEGRR